MSELKAISGHEIREDIDYNTRGIDPENKEWRNYGKELCDTLYYHKSEADKVIAELEKDKLELKQRVNVLEGRLFGLSQSHNIKTYTCGCLEREISELKNEKEYTLEHTTEVINAQEREIRHSKYKRCLAMARWCESEAYIHEHGSDYDEDLVAWFGKWHKRWLELAKKFKEEAK